MWFYYVGGTILAILLSVVYFVRRAYNKIRPRLLPGIPYPPLSHAILGHHDLILHPLKHELRAHIAETMKTPIHQVVMMKHVSVFVNDPALAFSTLKQLPCKGMIYNAFRYNPDVPDIIASDGEDHRMRSEALSQALVSMPISVENKAFSHLRETLATHAQSGRELDFKEASALFALQLICSAAFGIEATDSSFWEGKSAEQEMKIVLAALATLTDAQLSTTVYELPDLRKVSKEELAKSKEVWKGFIGNICNHVSSEHCSAPLVLALRGLTISKKDTYDEKCLFGDVHQLLKHAVESIAGTLCWLIYVLHRHPSVRARLEEELLRWDRELFPVNGYAEAVLLETFRRHPVAGNMTARTVECNQTLQTAEGIVTIPAATPVHIHMLSLQTHPSAWSKGREFSPDRWLDTERQSEAADDDCKPRCPFVSAVTNPSDTSKSVDASTNTKEQYDALYSSGCRRGASDKTLTFLPFSFGDRMCTGKDFSLRVLREVLCSVLYRYHLDPVTEPIHEDYGMSVAAVVVPRQKSSTTVLVSEVTNPGLIEKKKKTEEGWADEDEDEDADS